MNKKIINTGGDNKNSSFEIGFYWKPKIDILDELCENDNPRNIGYESSLQIFESRLRKQIIIKKRILISVAIITILMIGFGVVASRISIFNRSERPHEIKFTTSNEKKSSDILKNKIIRYDTLEAVSKQYKLSLPILNELPENLEISNIITDEYDDLLKINAIYKNTKERVRYVKIGYLYYKSSDKYKNTQERTIDIKSVFNITYDPIKTIEVLGRTTEIYSDVERQMAIFDYGEYKINVETNYSEEQLVKMLEKIKIIKR